MVTTESGPVPVILVVIVGIGIKMYFVILSPSCVGNCVLVSLIPVQVEVTTTVAGGNKVTTDTVCPSAVGKIVVTERVVPVHVCFAVTVGVGISKML